MLGKIAICTSAILLATPAWAQRGGGPTIASSTRTPPSTEPVRLQTVTVTGLDAGPALWKVSKDGHVMWVLGTLAPLPKGAKWRSARVEQAIARSQELLEPPSAELQMDPHLYSRLAGGSSAQRNPGGAHLQELLPPDMFGRWESLKHQYLGDSASLERDRPIFVTEKLYTKALDSVGLTEQTGVADAVEKLARRHSVKIVPVAYQLVIDLPRTAAQPQEPAGARHLGCFDQTMDTIQNGLGALTTRANAWAVGDLRTVQQLSRQYPYQSCVVTAINGDFEKQLGIADLPARLENTWLSAARAAMARNRETFALLPMEQLLSPGNYLARLEASGYDVQPPQETAAH